VEFFKELQFVVVSCWCSKMVAEAEIVPEGERPPLEVAAKQQPLQSVTH
jgi:hypothetical protein